MISEIKPKSAEMEYLAAPFKASRIALGTWAMGGWMWGGTDEAEAIGAIHEALDHGVTLIDTAPAYGFGRSEEIVGNALAEGGLRKRVLIATKVGLVQTVQSPYNLFERAIESDVLPYCRDRKIVTLAYGSVCRGLLSGRMTSQTRFVGDDLRKTDPKFQAPRFAQYLRAVERLDRFAQANYGRRVIHLALRWVLDRQDSMIALWGARRPDQLSPIGGLAGWHIDSSAMAEIDRILSDTIIDPVGPEFMAPPVQLAA
jgi:aryl-alcohol dehydrogenase-like predicted oxidoreductase